MYRVPTAVNNAIGQDVISSPITATRYDGIWLKYPSPPLINKKTIPTLTLGKNIIIERKNPAIIKIIGGMFILFNIDPFPIRMDPVLVCNNVTIWKCVTPATITERNSTDCSPPL